MYKIGHNCAQAAKAQIRETLSLNKVEEGNMILEAVFSSVRTHHPVCTTILTHVQTNITQTRTHAVVTCCAYL